MFFSRRKKVLEFQKLLSKNIQTINHLPLLWGIFCSFLKSSSCSFQTFKWSSVGWLCGLYIYCAYFNFHVLKDIQQVFFRILLYIVLALCLFGNLMGWNGLPIFFATDHIVSAKISLDIISCPGKIKEKNKKIQCKNNQAKTEKTVSMCF